MKYRTIKSAPEQGKIPKKSIKKAIKLISVPKKIDPINWIKRHIEMLSVKWPPRSETMKKSRRPSMLDDKRTKWEYKCNHCNKWLKGSQIELDHITPKGRYARDTFLDWLDKLFCPAEGFQVLCISCHLIKTNKEKIDGSDRKSVV